MKFPARRQSYRSLEWVAAAALVLAGGQFLRGVAQSYCTVSISPTSTTISSAGGTVSFNAYTNCALSILANNSWLHALISSLPTSGVVQATVDANSSASSRTGTIQLTPSGGLAGFSALFQINQGATCVASKLAISTPGTIGFSVSLPVIIKVTILDDCGIPLTSGSVFVSFSDGDPSLTLTSLGAGVWQGTWTPRNLASQVTLTITAASATLSGQATLQASIANLISSPSISAVTEGAGFRSGGLAPGSFISIFGSNLANGTQAAAAIPIPTTLATTSVSVGGKLMALFYVSPSQINGILPNVLPTNVTIQLSVANGNNVSAPFTLLSATASPGIFSVDQSGSGQGVIANQDSSINSASNPAARGDVVVIYCSGLGAVSPPVADGTASPFEPVAQTTNLVSVTIGAANAPVQFAGLTPGLVSLYQINAIVPFGIAAGDQVPVMVSVAGIASPTVTMAVK